MTSINIPNTTILQTPQEEFWTSKFGESYIARNSSKEIVASNVSLFSNVLKSIPSQECSNVNTILEFGANIGMNLNALKILLPQSQTIGVELNKKAYKILSDNIYCDKALYLSILDDSFKSDNNELMNKSDFTLSKGLLIHIAPEKLLDAYTVLYNSTNKNKYICLVEYYNPTPVMLPYRGHDNKLFKRDFAGEMLEYFSSLSLIDYGFVYHKDTFMQDDVHWWLLKKNI